MQRRLDNLAERFTQANHEPFAQRLSELGDKLCKNPICAEHYETDIHWAVLHLLLEIARNPVAGLAQNRRNIALFDVPAADANVQANSEPAALVAELLEANFAVVSDLQQDVNEELSVSVIFVIYCLCYYHTFGTTFQDWSDSDSDNDANIPIKPVESTFQPNSNEASSHKCSLPGIKPPEPQPNFARFNGANSINWLSSNIQRNWWLDDQHIHPSISSHPESQFCATWSKLVAKVNLQNLGSTTETQQIPAATISTISEYCLLREVLWLFSEPIDCKMFQIDTQTDTITSRPNVSLNSISVPALRSALRHFTHYATICMRLRRFCDAVDGCAAESTGPSPHTYECYGQAVRQCMRPFATFIRRTERTVVAQRPDTQRPQSLVGLHRDMEAYTVMLDNLYAVHVAVTLDFRRQPAHICATHLVAGLLRAHETSSSLVRSNLAAALLIVSLRVYMQIIETWWTDGRLEDWREEFVIKK